MAEMTQAERDAEAKRLMEEAGYGPDNPLSFEMMYNTDEATDTECVMWCQMGGQIGPLPNKNGARKTAVGGMRQRIEMLGGLRCIVAERDEGCAQPPYAHLRTDYLRGATACV